MIRPSLRLMRFDSGPLLLRKTATSKVIGTSLDARHG
jgi:hypothetical protein